MIEIDSDSLLFHFDQHKSGAYCRIAFQRTLRLPDDNREYPLPPGLGNFHLEHVDDYSDKLPPNWREHGGVFFPMYQSEAMWIALDSNYPCAVRIAAGKINAVTGERWSNTMDSAAQDYLAVPGQPWLDGFNVGEGLVRQFVAMPLGDGFTAEEQLTGKAQTGGIQIAVFPMLPSSYRRYFSYLDKTTPFTQYCLKEEVFFLNECEIGLAPGGLMHQDIYEDEYQPSDYDDEAVLRCFAHIVNSETYQSVTDKAPPLKPPSAKSYSQNNLPWFDYYDEKPALAGSKALAGLDSVAALTIKQGKAPLPDNEAVTPATVITLNKKAVRSGDF